MTHDHHEDYTFEKDYWGNCCNTFDEEQKHFVYASFMGIPKNRYSFILPNRSVMDIGGGPSSMLLKCKGLKNGKIVDPIEYPQWTKDRYKLMNIEVDVKPGEEVTETDAYDEVWIYNCMQHAIDPEQIITNAKRAGKILRLFEWIDVPAHEGHPHELTESNLNEWIGSSGKTATLSLMGCFGKAYINTINT
jgi:hypothetical protein